ncbi:MAG: DUF349 domain-containing protein [Cyclobacteriaceae bacterium]
MTKKDIPHGFILDGKLFRLGLDGGDAVLLQELTSTDEADAIRHFEGQYQKLLSSFNELENRILGTENKGSFLAKLINLKNSLAEHAGLGDYDFIYKKVVLYENQIHEIIQGNRKRNTDIKNALLLELEESLKNNDYHEVGQAIKDIKQRWMKTGNAEEAVNGEVESRFNELVEGFYAKRQSFFDDKKKLISSRIKKYDEVISGLSQIVEKKSLAKSLQEVKQLQENWKAIGHVPESEYKTRNAKYWELCKLFYNELSSEKKSTTKEDFKDNLKLKKAIIEQLQQLEKDALYKDVRKLLEESKKVWKSIGRVPKSETSSLNKAFLGALDSISEKRFVFQLAGKKFKGFEKKTVDERNKLLAKLVKELLARDKNDLAIFKENMDNMHVNKGTFVEMLEKKQNNLEIRVQSKLKVLKELQSDKTEK